MLKKLEHLLGIGKAGWVSPDLARCRERNSLIAVFDILCDTNHSQSSTSVISRKGYAILCGGCRPERRCCHEVFPLGPKCQRLHCWVTNVFGNKRYVPHPLCWLPRSWYPFAQVALRYFPCRPDKPRFFEDGVRSRLPAQTNPLTDWDKEDSGIFQWHSPCFWSCC